ncbi:hypothetical protein GA0115258_12411, partial [Streptomyces sp. LamerLS-31b]
MVNARVPREIPVSRAAPTRRWSHEAARRVTVLSRGRIGAAAPVSRVRDDGVALPSRAEAPPPRS